MTPKSLALVSLYLVKSYSPKRTISWFILRLWMQCAAVRTCRSVISAPPQNACVATFAMIAAIQGHSPGSAGRPPEIFGNCFVETPQPRSSGLSIYSSCWTSLLSMDPRTGVLSSPCAGSLATNSGVCCLLVIASGQHTPIELNNQKDLVWVFEDAGSKECLRSLNYTEIIQEFPEIHLKIG